MAVPAVGGLHHRYERRAALSHRLSLIAIGWTLATLVLQPHSLNTLQNPDSVLDSA